MKKTYPEISFGDTSFTYSIIRTDRKTMAIVVEPEGTVIVRAPYDVSEETIEEKVKEKRKWVAEKITKTDEIVKPVPKKRELVSGEKIKLKDKLIRLKIHQFDKRRMIVELENNTLHIYVNQHLNESERKEELKNAILKWYKEQAKDIISKRVEKYSKSFDIKPRGIVIRSQQLRWGSCTRDNQLNFNWRIVMAPVSAIDYIIIHELCHLKEPLHSLEFWNLLEAHFPEYRKWKEWLRINGLTLDLQFK